MSDKPNKNKPLMTKPQISTAIEKTIADLSLVKDDVLSLEARFFEHDLNEKALDEAYEAIREAIRKLYEAGEYVC